MDFIYAIGGAFLVSLIITIIEAILTLGKKKPSDSNFFQKFTGTLMVLIVIVIIGTLSEKCGCSSSEDEPDYPMKYHPD